MSPSKKSSDEHPPAGGLFSDLLDEANPDKPAKEEEVADAAPPEDAPPEASPPEASDTINDEAADEEGRTGDTLDGVGFTLPWPPKPVVTSASQVEAARPATGETEGLAQSMPDIGALPYNASETDEQWVVRLVSSAEDSDLSIELQPGMNKIGRQRNDNHIVLVSPDISRFHAEITVSADAITISDMNSSNGTFVNGMRVMEQELNAGDVVAFSDEFSFQVLIDLPLSSPDTLTLSRGQGSVEGEPVSPRDTEPEEVWKHTPAAGLVPPDHMSLKTWDATMDEPPPPAEELPVEPATVERPMVETLVEPPQPEPAPEPPPEPLPPPEPPPRTSTKPGRESPHEEHAPLPELDLLPEPEPPLEPAPLPEPVPLPEQPMNMLPEPGMPLLPEQVPEPEPSSGLVEEDTHLTTPAALERNINEAALTIPSSREVVELERERRQLAVLYQVSKRCMMARDLEELDKLLINVLERMVAFQRAFITYRLPSGDWKLVMSKHKYRWDKQDIRRLLHLARRSRESLLVQNSQEQPGLGVAEDGLPDTRLLLPLWVDQVNLGAVFLVSQLPNSFENTTLGFLELFAEVAALALYNGAKKESG